MTARTIIKGKVYRWEERNTEWVMDRPATCRCEITIPINVKIPTDLSSTKRGKWRVCNIDKCVAPLVEALQNANIDMRGSCCGHGEMNGDIHLQDGRVLVIKSGKYLKARKKNNDSENDNAKVTLHRSGNNRKK